MTVSDLERCQAELFQRDMLIKSLTYVHEEDQRFLDQSQKEIDRLSIQIISLNRTINELTEKLNNL